MCSQKACENSSWFGGCSEIKLQNAKLTFLTSSTRHCSFSSDGMKSLCLMSISDTLTYSSLYPSPTTSHDLIKYTTKSTLRRNNGKEKKSNTLGVTIQMYLYTDGASVRPQSCNHIQPTEDKLLRTRSSLAYEDTIH